MCGPGEIRVGSGDLTVEDSWLIDGVGGDVDGGTGGAISVACGEALIVTGSVIRGNSANTGGGIDSSGVETTLTTTLIADNSAEQGGAQVADALLIANAITVNGDSAVVAGGGLQTFRSAMQVSNNTIGGNSAGAKQGAGVSLGVGSGPSHVTVVGNTVGIGVGGDFGSVSLENSIIVHNPAGGCQTNLRIEFVGSTVDSDGTCGANLTTATPRLAPLAYWGGPAHLLAHALGSLSSAIDAAPSCTLTVAQRGESQPQGAACDLGAYEATPDTAEEAFADILDQLEAVFAWTR